jgi:hypothetical protein
MFSEARLSHSRRGPERWDQIQAAEPGRYKEGHSLMARSRRACRRSWGQKHRRWRLVWGFDWADAEPVYQ